MKHEKSSEHQDSSEVRKLTEKDVTPESVYFGRREVLQTLGFGLASGIGFHLESKFGLFDSAEASSVGLPAKLNTAFDLKDKERPITKEELALKYNNFYEFSLDKDEVQHKVKDWNPGPWKVKVHGLCAKPKTWDLDELLKRVSIEERIYRFRCVETWAMVLPWSGFQMSELIKLAEPTAAAKFVKFVSLGDSKVMPNIKKLPYYPWPYTEGLTIEEAKNPLAIFATGLYGKPLPKQNGAPIRAVLPWKYGFKSAKSIVEIEFTSEQPKTLWPQLASAEYGFYANVNPEVPHPRWSQAKETLVDGSFFPAKKPTLKFNGYEKEVASLYAGLDLKKNF